MGRIRWKLENMVNTITDIVAIKSQLILSEEELLQILKEEFPDEDIFTKYDEYKSKTISTRAETFDEYCWYTRKKLGELESVRHPVMQHVQKMMKWEEKGHNTSLIAMRVTEYLKELSDLESPKLINPEDLLAKSRKEELAPDLLILEILKSFSDHQRTSNNVKPFETVLLESATKLSTLFEQESIPKDSDEFIEQKFINFLEANPDKAELMHWRNFERLTAEFFRREGYVIELGPGRNDGGIDVKAYKKDNDKTPYLIIQCKRHRATNQVSIETVKSFYTDVEYEGAKIGLVATTSKVAIGGKKVTSIRKYPIEFAENADVINWLNKMKKR